ncbi:tripartite motif-containing protein 2-like [Apostichopus japonicus]|uniref:tripartite motif-containing protein 2-like n=1 Tax=Stichopus japonicus TaxID=307972 RepID=UPI003AB80FCD
MAANYVKADELDRQFLQCALCIDRLQKPKLLPCQHTFCQSCLELWVTQNGGTLSCPFCRNQYSLTQKGVAGLPDNFFVNNIIDFINRKRTASSAAANCDSCENEASDYCYDCAEFMCMECTAAHKRLRTARQHKITSIDEYLSDLTSVENVYADDEAKFCGSHEGQEIEIYCESCGVPICQKCRAKDHEGSGHELIQLTEAGRTSRKILSDLADRAREKVDSLRETVSMLKETNRLLHGNREAALSQIKARKRALMELIEAFGEEAEAELEQEYTCRKETLEKDIDYFQQTLDKTTSVCNVTQNLLNEGDDEALLYVSRDTIHKLEENVASQVRPKTDDDGRIKFISGNCKGIERVDQLGFIEKTTKQHKLIPSPHLRPITTAKSSFVVGETANVTLNSTDNEGNIATSGGIPITAKVFSPSGEVGIAKVQDRKDGQYDIVFRPRIAGKHKLVLAAFGRQMSVEPYELNVMPLQRKILTFGNPSLPECIKSSVTLQEPCGVAISHRNNEIFVADTGNHTIRVFDMNGNYKTQMTYLNMTNDFEPMGMALANEGRVILVTDAGNRQVLICARDGNLLRRFGDAHLRRPCGIAVSRSGLIIVADVESHCIFVYNSSGELLTKVGKFGTERGQFRRPFGVAVDSYDNIVVSDRDNHRLQIISPKGEVLSIVGDDRRSAGDNDRLLKYPTGVAVDKDDNIYVCSDWDAQVLMFDSKGSFLKKVLSSEVEGLKYPNGIAVGNDGRLVIVDYGQNCGKIVEA